MMLCFSQITELLSGKIIQLYSDKTITQLQIDSRTATYSEGALFFAISGKMHDGHRFLVDLYQKGIRQFVVEREDLVELSLLPEANVILVNNSIEALQAISTFNRNQFQLPVVAITGSNGKTIIKEWLYQLLSPDFSIVKSPKSYNSQIGVPLSVWQIRPEHNLGIFEAGISHSGEMKNLARIIQPTIGIFSNIGPAHSEGFSSIEEKIEEKAKLFVNANKIIYCKAHQKLATYLETRFSDKKLITWQISSQLSVVSCRLIVTTNFEQRTLNYELPFKDAASIENLMHCIVLMLELGIDEKIIQKRILRLANIPMRLELKAGKNNNYIIDDTYNNDPEGLKIALQFMQQQNMKQQKILILSDLLETGISAEKLYQSISDLSKDNNISQFVGVGTEIGKCRDLFPSGSIFFKTTEEMLLSISNLKWSDSLILIKGARVFGFERVVQVLAQKLHRTVLEINLNALVHNLQVFRQMIKPETKMMVMVKAFAYGSGSHEVAHLLQYHKVDYLAVAYTDEGVELRENNIKFPIMVMNPSSDEFEKLAKYHLEPELYSIDILKAFVNYQSTVSAPDQRADQKLQTTNLEPRTTKVHLAIDTGMHRLGFEEFQIDELCDILKANGIKVASVFSHLVGSDGAEHDSFSDLQAKLFERIVTKIESALGYKVIKHLLNSAGIARLGKYQYDMVRLGIGLYGVESEGHPQNAHLQNVSSLKTTISQIRKVTKGESIGYSRKGLAERDSTIATLAIGYADGYSRIFGNGVGKVWIKGKLAPIIGNVCMDMCMADVTGINCEAGEQVVIFGEELPVLEVANWANTISYEILTNVSERVKRVFYLD